MLYIRHRTDTHGPTSAGDGEKELMDALKEMGIKKMGHRQAIVGAVVGKL